MRYLRKSQKREPEFKGAITAFLALIFALLISLVGALVESASIQMTKNRRRADAILAMESTFAEYDRDLLEQYDLFAREACDEAKLQRRMEYYGADQMEHGMVKKELLTDNDGYAFREQAIRYAKNWLGVDMPVEETEYEFYSETYLEEEELVYMDMDELLAQDENTLPEEGNPISAVQRLKSMDFLTLVHPNPQEISSQSIAVEGLASGRELQSGNWGKPTSSAATDKAFFAAYLTEHFGSFAKPKESSALCYEQEYLLAGHPGDRENLEAVCKQILSIRMVVNYGYLLTDTAKQAEAGALALTLCSLLTVPGIAEVVKHATLLAWAYGESVVDVRALLKGKKVPVVKTADSWQLQLANLITLGTVEEAVNEFDAPGGLNYQNYLLGLLVIERQGALSMRSLDLIESNLHIRADEYMTKLEINSKATLRRGAKDSFATFFGYE